MSSESGHCAKCGSALAADQPVCATCGAENPRPSRSPPRHAPANGSGSPEVARRVERLEQWAAQSAPLGLQLPVLPSWAAEAARAAPNEGEPWTEVIRGVERLAQTRVLASLRDWEKQTKSRLARLEAYSVDSRLERDQIEDVLTAARAGEVSRALASFQQVDRVVALKERHLNQAREELERLVSLLSDMQAVGLPVPEEPTELSQVLERELRRGRLASLRQQLRQLRGQALEAVRSGLPSYVRAYGDFLIQERAEGVSVDVEVAELARGARAFSEGRIEEAVQRLRRLLQVHGSGVFRPPQPPREPTG